MNQKINTAVGKAVGLIDRVFRLSHTPFAQDNEKDVTEISTNNEYPLKLVRRLINRYKNRTQTTTSSDTITNNATTFRYSLQYVPAVFQPIAKSTQKKCDYVKIAFKNKNNAGKLFSELKDKQSIADSRNVVCISSQLQRLPEMLHLAH